MRTNGFYGIGCLNMKREFNYGTLFRTAQVFDADFLFVIGNRFKPQHSDTDKSWKNLPTYHYLNFKDFNDHRPFACVLVGIELTEKATAIAEFAHPRQACYLLRAEDSGLSPEAIEHCQSWTSYFQSSIRSFSGLANSALRRRTMTLTRHIKEPLGVQVVLEQKATLVV